MLMADAAAGLDADANVDPFGDIVGGGGGVDVGGGLSPLAAAPPLAGDGGGGGGGVGEYILSLFRDTCIAGLVAIFVYYCVLNYKGKGPTPETVEKFQDEGHDDYPSLYIPDDILPYLGVPVGVPGSKKIDIRSLCTCEKFDDIYPYLPFDIGDYNKNKNTPSGDENNLEYDIYYSEKLNERGGDYATLSYQVKNTKVKSWWATGGIGLIMVVIFIAVILATKGGGKVGFGAAPAALLIEFLLGLLWYYKFLKESKRLIPVGEEDLTKDELLDEKTINNRRISLERFNRLPSMDTRKFVDNGDEKDNLNPYNLSYKLLTNTDGTPFTSGYNGGCKRNKTLCRTNYYNEEEEFNSYEGTTKIQDSNKEVYCIPWKTLVIGLHKYLIEKHWTSKEKDRLSFYAYNDDSSSSAHDRNGDATVSFNALTEAQWGKIFNEENSPIPDELKTPPPDGVYWKGFGYVIYIITQVRNNTYIRDKNINYKTQGNNKKKLLYEFYDDNIPVFSPNTNSDIYMVILLIICIVTAGCAVSEFK